jgi:hypothetical protein
MVNKKSQFIDKKHSATYHLVCNDTGHGVEAAAAAEAASGAGADEERVFARVAVRGVLQRDMRSAGAGA